MSSTVPPTVAAAPVVLHDCVLLQFTADAVNDLARGVTEQLIPFKALRKEESTRKDIACIVRTVFYYTLRFINFLHRPVHHRYNMRHCTAF